MFVNPGNGTIKLPVALPRLYQTPHLNNWAGLIGYSFWMMEDGDTKYGHVRSLSIPWLRTKYSSLSKEAKFRTKFYRRKYVYLHRTDSAKCTSDNCKHDLVIRYRHGDDRNRRISNRLKISCLACQHLISSALPSVSHRAHCSLHVRSSTALPVKHGEYC